MATLTKPRSMGTGARNIVRSCDSASLWNCSLSPGWTREEVDVLKLALLKFGIGNWSAIMDSGCLPGKTVSQLNNQAQRMLGQQSTAEFAGLHIDPLKVGEDNNKKQGDHFVRKGGILINTGDRLSREQIQRKIEDNRKKYELMKSEEWERIDLPKPKIDSSSLPLLLEGKRSELKKLRKELNETLELLKVIRVT